MTHAGFHEEEVTVASVAPLQRHRTWEDWVGMGLGALILVSPFLVNDQFEQAMTLNALLTGLLVIIVSELELYGAVTWEAWEEVISAALGVWLMVSPFVLGYANAGQLRFWHFVLGALVVLLAAVEFWQDWNLPAQELPKHGQ
jgi:hypothetical protein